MSSNNQNNDEQTDLKKEEMSEKIIQKWLILQKTIKEEITLEDVIISQLKTDFSNLKTYFKEYYTAKLDIRKTFDDIKKLENDDFDNIKELYIENNINKVLLQATQPIKNLLFLFRNDYNYITKLVSLIDEQDKDEQIDSLVQLFCNQFYDNILIPNPEQEELLILIYKLFDEEIRSMNSALIDDFLNESSFMGKFCTSYMNKQEFKVYLSMLVNPLILSIQNEDEECLNMSLISIRDFIKKKIKEKKITKDDKNNDVNLDDILFKEIPKTKLVFKKNIEIETELEEESQRKNNSEMQKQSKSDISDSGNDNIKENNIKMEYNNGYKEQLNFEKFKILINHEKDPDLKDFYLYQIEQINNDNDIFTNKKLFNILEEKIFHENKKSLVEKYKSNFLFIQKKVDFLLQSLFDKISTIPYPVRCICKIIYLLISKKFPLLPKYLRNSFVGKFFFEKSIFPILNLKNKNVTESIIFSTGTKNCLIDIINILSNANKSILFNGNNDAEKTIFNYYLIEIIPILNTIYDKLIDIKLPKVLEDLISEKKIETEENENDNKENNENKIKKNGKQYDYFKENSDEILHLQCICFSIQDILFIINLINKNINSFKDLDKNEFFMQNVENIKKEVNKLNLLINRDTKSNKYFVIFQDEKNSKLEKLTIGNSHNESTFIKGEKKESDFVCKRIKICIKTILKGLNLLNKKDLTYLNMATSSDKFFTAIKYISEDLGELREAKNRIPLKWYGQYISNNKTQLNTSYQQNDFEKLYDEIYNEESNILNELKLFSSIIITRDGMNLRCAEKILEKIKYDLKQIKKAKKFLKIEKFVSSEEIEVCIKTRDMFKNINMKNIDFINNQPAIIITEGTNCEHKNVEDLNNNINTNTNLIEPKIQQKKIPFHAYYIKDFINKFSDNPWGSDKNNKEFRALSQLIKEDISSGTRKNQIYVTLEKYMDIIKKRIKYSQKNRKLFENITEREIEEFSEKIEDHILRNIYKFVYIDVPLQADINFYEKTLCLDWVEPEQLEIKKVYVNQLGYAELFIKKIDEAKSVFDKLDCIKSAHTNMNNTIKFNSGKNDDAGQDELTPIFQYIVIRAQPKRIYSDINYIKCFLGDSSLRGQEGFLVTQMESATSFITLIDHEQLKMTKEEYDKKILDAKKRHGLTI